MPRRAPRQVTDDRRRVSPLTPAVLGRIASTALVRSIPAVLLLPCLLVLLAISVAASDGSLLEIAAGIRGKVLTALGPLLVASGVATVVLAWRYGAADIEDWLGVGVFAALAIGSGAAAIRYSLRRIARDWNQRP